MRRNAFFSAVLRFIDCQAQTIGADGYTALASPSSSASLALTALLTLFVSVVGVRMLMGQPPAPDDLLPTALKLGTVLLLAGSWPAYRVLAYDTVLMIPAEILDDVGAASSLPGSGGGLVERLQGADDAIVTLSAYGAGRLSLAAEPGTRTRFAVQPAVKDDLAYGLTRMVFLISAIASLGSVRLVAGLLLALAPLFAGLLLFEWTRGIFMGWLHMLVASALAALGVTFLLAVELALLEPWLASVLAQRAARIPTPAAPVELLAMILGFSATLPAMILVAIRVAFGFHATTKAQPKHLTGARDRMAQLIFRPSPLSFEGAQPPAFARPPAIVEALSASWRRDTPQATFSTKSDHAMSRLVEMNQGPNDFATVPVGHSFRRIRARASVSADRRDSKA